MNEKENEILKDLIDISDKEFEDIKKYYKKINANMEKKVEEENTIAKVITVIAIIIFICGFIIGFILSYDKYDGFYFSILMLVWCVSAMSGIMLLGFAEIIKLLEKIKNK